MIELSSLVEMDYRLARQTLSVLEENRIVRGLTSLVVNTFLLRGVVPMTVLWFLWFRPVPDMVGRRLLLIGTLMTSVAAIFIGRGLANFLPFRPRPLAEPQVMGDQAQADAFLSDWSSMPSDHAMLFCAIAAGVYLVSRPAGIFLFLYAIFVVSLSRIFVGYHYLSDIVVGGLIGAILGFVLTPFLAGLVGRIWVALPTGAGRLYQRDIGYALLFWVTFQFATMFDGARLIVRSSLSFLTGE